MKRRPEPRLSPAAQLCVGFFVVSGVLELAFPVLETSAPGALWSGTGQALLHWLLAAGLWCRLALCRIFALVYCLAALVTYGVVLGLALAQAPIRFPTPVIVMSLFQVPSCAVLLPWLRSPAALVAFPRPLAG
jgi:hypothetical protein